LRSKVRRTPTAMPERMRPRVFVVDDQPFVRLAVRMALVREGYDVVELADGQALLDALATTRAPDLILSDECMPRLRGLEALARLRRDGVEVPFVLMSGSLDQELAAEARRLGATALLPKPFGLTPLLEVVAEQLAPRAKARTA
jgi:CheY-like chemotaxis protein